MNCKEFIEKAVDIKNALNELEKTEPDGVQLCTVSRSDVHIFNNINILADRLGIQLKCKKRGDKQYPYEYYFYYTNCYSLISAQRIRDGNYTVPDDTRLKDNSGFAALSDADAVEIPF